MSLEYYLCSRRAYNTILNELQYIINIHDEIEEVNKEICHDYLDKTFNPSLEKNFFIEKEQKITELRDICNDKVMELCHHEFVDDMIDISPDKSQYITYCKICEFTK